MKDFSGKVVIVTGGGGNGIGHNLVLELAKRGAHVAFCDITGLESTQKSLAAFDVSSFSANVDMADREAIAQFISEVVAKFGRIDAVFNNAGIALGDRLFSEVQEKDFDRITNINYWGVIYTTLQCYPHLLKSPDGAIVNISSTQGIMPLPNLVPYCTTKFAVRGFTDSLRTEHKIHGIKNISVHTVHPGAVATNITMNSDYINESSKVFHAELQNNGVTPQRAAEVICNGVIKDKGRIFISNGWMHELIMRLIPAHSYLAVKLMMKIKGF